MIKNLALVHIICFRHYADIYIMLKKGTQYLFTEGIKRNLFLKKKFYIILWCIS